MTNGYNSGHDVCDSLRQTQDVALYCGWNDVDAGGSGQNMAIRLYGHPDVVGQPGTVQQEVSGAVDRLGPKAVLTAAGIPFRELPFSLKIKGIYHPYDSATMLQYEGPWRPEVAAELQLALLGLAGALPAYNPD